MNILVFIVGFAMFGHYGMGDYKFPTKVEACRFVLEVDANYETNTFGYSIKERRNGRLVRRYNYPMGVADQMNRGIDWLSGRGRGREAQCAEAATEGPG